MKITKESKEYKEFLIETHSLTRSDLVSFVAELWMDFKNDEFSGEEKENLARLLKDQLMYFNVK